MFKLPVVFVAFICLSPHVAEAIDPVLPARKVWKQLDDPQLLLTMMGSSDSVYKIDAIVHREDLRYESVKTHILLVGRGSWESRSIGDALSWFYQDPGAAPYRDTFVVSALPTLYPRRRTLECWQFPPTAADAQDQDLANAMHLWRWVGMHAPDLVVEVSPRDGAGKWFVPRIKLGELDVLAKALKPATQGRSNELAAALIRHAACETGTIPALRVEAAGQRALPFLPELLAELQANQFRGPSPARRALRQRVARTPIQVAQQLSEHYGHDLKQVVYIPAIALIGRTRLGTLTDDPSVMADVERIVARYTGNEVDTTPKNGSGLSGHLVFAELASLTAGSARARYLSCARRAADLAFRPESRASGLMPYHSEMSDALFMGGPILAHVGHLTGEQRYFEACMRHLRAMRRLVLREDGLYRHSPLDEAAWGRGNGFPALGLAWCLTHWPHDRSDRDELLEMFRQHMSVLVSHQDARGCWHQVIDRHDTYRELSCTCMIAFAMARGVRLGWLDADKYGPAIEHAWYAIRARVAPNGRLVNVCTGTGKQKKLADYYQRRAILGPDPRGGAMALLVATELARVKPKR